MRYYLVLPLLLSCLISAAQQSVSHPEYKKFRTGTFEYTSGLSQGIMVERTKRKQYEYNPALKERITLVLKIEWPTDSEYILTFIKDPTNVVPKGVRLKATIMSVTDDSYTCHWESMNGPRLEGTVSLKKIK